MLFATGLAAQPVVSWSEETQRLQAGNVTTQGSAWLLQLTMDDDNGNGSLPSSYRRWWHCRVDGVSGGMVLNVRIENPGYTDIILPAWSLSTDGITFGPYTRVPTSATPVYFGGRHAFTLTVPAGTASLRLAKYFPYTVTEKDAYVAGLVGQPAVRSVSVPGTSWQGRPIEMIELTDTSVPDTGKRRVWIHAGIHPAETTSYWVVEGLIDFLTSGDVRAAALLRDVIFDVVPMTNPDGVFLGNYRTNALSVNLENQWGWPYNSTQPEIVALRTQLEAFMGTPSGPGANPAEVVLNLHSTHGLSWPYHYRHSANPSWHPTSNPSGVLPSVNALETAWINAFKARSAFVNQGATASSSCGSPTRPFLECMMHDRWSADPSWTGSPGNQPQVMAITFEGTYGPSPMTSWNTPADWRQVGQELALALGDHLGVLPSFTFTTSGTGCAGVPVLSANAANLGGTYTGFFVVSGAPALATGWLIASTTLVNLPLPPTGCPLLVYPDTVFSMPVTAFGSASLQVVGTPGVNLDLSIQFVAEVNTGSGFAYYPSNRVHVQVAW
ncbi:MAG: hypothetical protein HRU14_05365 [Planctomycetes bacterium]|nr:hypothetical protein [Planctomycetota bacterium]